MENGDIARSSLLMAIEDDFEVEIPDEEVENIKTVGALVEYIESHAKD